MKKLALLCLFGLLLSTIESTAQLSISPNVVYVEGILPDDFEGIGHSFVNNESTSNMNLTWERTVVEQTEGWLSAVCDLNQCYLTGVSSQSFGLGAGQSGTMDVHVYPNGIEGASIITIEVYQTNDPSNTTSATYYFNQGTNGIAEKFSEAIKIYPNPSQDWILIENSDNNVNTADIYDVKGRLVKSTTINGNQRIAISELPSGNYILKMMDRDGIILSTNHLVKM